MTRYKTIVGSIWILLAAAGPVAADGRAAAPSTLRMRGHASGTHWSPSYWSKRVAQAAPDQPARDPPGEGAPPVPPPAEAPQAPEAAAPAASVEATPNLTDAELQAIADQAAKEEVITVTGSTIERKTLTTPAPLSILNREDLDASGRSTIGDILQQLPAQANAINAQINNGGDGSTRVDIRGLGANRTLTLINGRRVVPGGTGADASVDLNSIPLAVIERVEVLKDGASAVYGSDAVGGVVNIITRSDFDGTETAFYTAGSPRGDGFTYNASFVAGHNSANQKGNIIFSAGLQSQHPVFAGDRTFSKRDMDFNYDNGKTVVGGSISNATGRIDATNIDKDGDGKADPVDLCGAGVQYCTNDGNGGYRPFETTDLYNYQPANYLLSPSSRYNIYSAGNYKVLPSTSAFFEASYLDRTSDQQLAPEPFSTATAGVAISKDSIYNTLGGDVNGYNRRLLEFGPRRALQNIGTFRTVAGFNGSIADDAPAFKNWKWEVSYNYGRTDGTNQNEGNLIVSHLANAIGPSFRDDSGTPTCGTRDAPIAGCVPMDILGPAGTIDAKARDYVTYTGISSGFNEQQTALATAHGRIAKLPNNGDLSVAVGTDFRKESGGFTPDPLTSTGDTTGNAQQPTKGSYNVVEGFGELSLVPLSGKKFAEWVEIDLAARGFRYDSFGSGVTWKAGGLFRTIGGVAVRGTYSTAFRAPSVAELFQGQIEGFPTVEDPCDTRPKSAGGGTIMLDPMTVTQCRAQHVADNASFGTNQQRAVGGGNPNLEAETAKVITAGVVYEPPQVKGLSLTADYWNVDITKAIQTIGTATILSNCYTRGQRDACLQIHRDAGQNYAIDYIDATTTNVGGTATSGLDTAIAYDRSFPGIGRFHEQLEAQYLFKYNLDNASQVLHGRGNYDLGVLPKIKANLSTVWQHKTGLGGGFNVRFIGAFKECKQGDCNGGEPSRDVDSWFKLDLYGSYALKSPAGKTTFSLGVNNVLDRAPPVIYIGNQGDSDGATYDLVGRLVYARLQHLF